jgi:hypothetical protein
MPSTRQAAKGAASGGGEGSSDRDNGKDDRGLKFGTEVVFDDAYGATGEESEFVSSLPTEEEERRMLEEESVYAREQLEDVDEGRVSSHPSTMAASSKVSACSCQRGCVWKTRGYCCLRPVTQTDLAILTLCFV